MPTDDEIVNRLAVNVVDAREVARLIHVAQKSRESPQQKVFGSREEQASGLYDDSTHQILGDWCIELALIAWTRMSGAGKASRGVMVATQKTTKIRDAIAAAMVENRLVTAQEIEDLTAEIQSFRDNNVAHRNGGLNDVEHKMYRIQTRDQHGALAQEGISHSTQVSKRVEFSDDRLAQWKRVAVGYGGFLVAITGHAKEFHELLPPDTIRKLKLSIAGNLEHGHPTISGAHVDLASSTVEMSLAVTLG